MNTSLAKAHGASTVTTSEPVRGVSLLLTVLIVALWAGNAVAVTFSVDWLPPVAVAAVRFALGTVVMFCWCLVERTRLTVNRQELGLTLVAAVLLFTQIATFNVGVLMTNSTHGVLLINTYIFVVIVLEHFLLRTEHIRRSQWLGTVLAASGVACIIQVRDPSNATGRLEFWQGDLVLLFSAVLLAIRIVFVRYAVQRISSSKLIFWHNLFSVIMFVTYSRATEQLPSRPAPMSATLGLLYQGLVVAGLCFVIHASLLKRHSASQISVFFFATPVFGVMFSVLLRGEPFTRFVAIGAGCVALGIWLATRPQLNSNSSGT